ncbi:MAG: alpha/beta fold hydrolase [Gomphosphaeria aponina SAG 52.96 = DSM 107014]|uniref:Alpha/beta fold hydrolase n=1 Tax=Gomphosphaeria aponina SAG 52.96 = DSM 107014 TaxID=1521640 RepID=A0A941JSQ6_9CHRO|nr:alpha/beta fold hydrolase [Gomphosphaeria aponina SAG 52.96 = DSM 107014]
MVGLTGNWQQRIGNQRDWVWRGWQIRYTYLRAAGRHEELNTPLILVHGFGAAIEHWRHNIPVLSEKHTVYALDLLGFGASRKPYTDYQVSLWVEQVDDFWRTFIRQPVVLVGNSIGSLVCLEAAVNHPEMVKGLVMLSLPDVSLREEMIPKLLQPVVKTIEGLVASPPVIKTLFQVLRRPEVIRRWAGVAYVNKEAITEELVEILAAPAQDEGAGRTFCALFKAVRQPEFASPVKKVLPKLQIPMLLIWGKGDRMVPPSLGPIFAGLNPQIQLVELEHVGHCPHDECPARFNQILLHWLAANMT